jgi:NAD(P)-dependent dehydrogenase (short-subunit alcohol dehydrogenase family)
MFAAVCVFSPNVTIMQYATWMDLLDHTVVVTGAASGIGAAVVDSLLAAGADVYTLDVAPVSAPVSQAVQCDLGDRASIDLALELMPPKVDWLMNCAGVPNGGRFTPTQVMAINWIGLRHLTEALLPRISGGGSVTHVASTAGRAWADNVQHHKALMQADSFDAGMDWVGEHDDIVDDGYSFSKEAVQYYTMWRALQVRPELDIRMNSLCPGITNTQLSQDFRRGVGDDVIDRAVALAGRQAEPAEMVGAMLFLADQRTASYVNGINLNVDRGTSAAHSLSAW